MSTVVLVRPGCTDFDEQKRIQGALDLPLNDRGQSQLRQVIEALRDEPVDLVLTGPGEPCRSMAEGLATALDVPLKEKRELRNLDQGLWQGLCIDDVRKKFPRVFKQWEEAPETVCPPQGETITDAFVRLEAVLKKPLRKYDRLAIVVSEPLATLISCVLQKTEPDALSDSMFGCCNDQLVEVIETSKDAGSCGCSCRSVPIAATSDPVAELN